MTAPAQVVPIGPSRLAAELRRSWPTVDVRSVPTLGRDVESTVRVGDVSVVRIVHNRAGNRVRRIEFLNLSWPSPEVVTTVLAAVDAVAGMRRP